MSLTYCHDYEKQVCNPFANQRGQEYLDQREALIKALIAGEKSGASNRSLDAIWSGIKKSMCKLITSKLLDKTN